MWYCHVTVSQLRLEYETDETSMESLRPALEAALREQFPSGLLEGRWQEETLLLQGPGADGAVVLDGGKLVASASLRPPATLMRPMIEGKISAALRSVVGENRRGRVAKS